MKTLVIDDEAPIRLLCRVNLEAEGVEVLEAADGATGLALAKREKPDAILLDVMMPGLDGWNVAERLLSAEETRAIPIIFLTARADLRDRVRGMDAGGSDTHAPGAPVEQVHPVCRAVEPHPHQRSCPAAAAGEPADVLTRPCGQPAVVVEGVVHEEVARPAMGARLDRGAEMQAGQTPRCPSVVHHPQELRLRARRSGLGRSGPDDAQRNCADQYEQEEPWAGASHGAA